MPRARSAAKKAKTKPPKLGALPEWNLADLYEAIDSPKVKLDLEKGDAECAKFEADYKGRLEELARNDPAALAEALKRYEAIEDLLGRVISYAVAGLCRQYGRSGPHQILRRCAGAHHRGLAASPVLHAGIQPHRRCRARQGDGGALARPLPALDRGCAEGKALSARGSRRAAVPREIGDRPIRPGTGCSTRPSRRCASRSVARSWASSRRSTSCRTATRRSARPPREALAETFKENIRLFTLITNTLAKDKEISDRWRGFEDVAAARHLSNRVEPEVVDALVAGGARRLSAAVAPLLRAQGQVVRQEEARRIGTATRRCRRSRSARSRWSEARETVLTAYGAFSPKHGRASPSASSTSAGSMRRCGPASSRAPSRIRPCRRRILMCCSTTRASRAT